jgi:hypothetical protein
MLTIILYKLFPTSRSVGQILWNLKIHYSGHSSSLLKPVLAQMNTANILKPYLILSFPLRLGTPSGLGPTQPPIQYVLGALSLRVKQPGLEANHSPLCKSEVKECLEIYLHSPNSPSWRGAQLKYRDKFILPSAINGFQFQQDI